MNELDTPNLNQILRNQQSLRVTMDAMADEYPTAMARGCKREYFAALRAWVDLLESASPTPDKEG